MGGAGGGVVEANQPLIELNVPGTVKIKQMVPHPNRDWSSIWVDKTVVECVLTDASG